MMVNDPIGDMIARIKNAAMRKRSKVDTPASKMRARVLDVLQDEGYIRGYHLVREARRVPGVRDRAEVLRRRARDRRDQPRVQAWPPRLFVDQGPEAGQERPRASRSCRRPRASCPTPPPATPMWAAKCSAGSTRDVPYRKEGGRHPARGHRHPRRPDGHGEGPQGPALLDRGRRDRGHAGRRRTDARQRDDSHARASDVGPVAHPGRQHGHRRHPGLRADRSNWSASAIAPR